MVYFCFIVITTCYRSIIQCREHIASYVAYLCSIVAKAFQHILHRMKIYLLQSAPNNIIWEIIFIDTDYWLFNRYGLNHQLHQFVYSFLEERNLPQEKKAIRGYITQDECYLNPAKTISFGQDTATIFYQEKPYFTGDKIKVMSYRDCELNPELACYLLTVMRKAFQNFAWGQSSFNENVLKNMEIRLPVDSNDNIDYTYITAFIKAQEKLSIKSVIDWKDKIINTSKKCI